MNLISLCFCFSTLIIIILGSLLNLYEKRLPAFLSKSFRYGKFCNDCSVKGIISRAVIEVPKSWFRHFYCVGVLAYSTAFYLVTSVYVFGNDAPEWVVKLLDVLCGEDRLSHVSATRTYLAVTLMTLQVFRRFYDTHFVSIFGKNSRMNFTHYVVGLIHYPGTSLAILCEAPVFTVNFSADSELNFSELTYADVGAVVVFLWAWWHQYSTTKILADLRKDKKGNIMDNKHMLPHGDWFKYLSAPHQSAEILMYMSITVLLWYNITWFFVFAWVISNQVETILLTHWWYKETFDKFPKNRKALIPFLY